VGLIGPALQSNLRGFCHEPVAFRGHLGRVRFATGRRFPRLRLNGADGVVADMGSVGGFGLVNGAYTLDPPHYFSLFPPVYYSPITPRPYGSARTPILALWRRRSAFRSRRLPMFHGLRRAAVRQPAGDQTAAQPVIIKNPFVLPEAERPTRLADGRPVPQTFRAKEVATASTSPQIDMDR